MKVNTDDVINLLEKKEIRTPITKENMIKNWSIAKEQQTDDLGSIYCKKTVDNSPIKSMIDAIDFDETMPD